MGLTLQDLLTSGLTAARQKGSEHDVVVGEVGDQFDEGGEGCRVTLVPHYLLVEIRTSEDEGEFWIPTMNLLELIGDLNRKIGS